VYEHIIRLLVSGASCGASCGGVCVAWYVGAVACLHARARWAVSVWHAPRDGWSGCVRVRVRRGEAQGRQKGGDKREEERGEKEETSEDL
jgi:hypothetical protein